MAKDIFKERSGSDIPLRVELVPDTHLFELVSAVSNAASLEFEKILLLSLLACASVSSVREIDLCVVQHSLEELLFFRFENLF